MIIAVVSGKGGAGQTTLSVGLTQAWVNLGRPVQLLDCDVAEPNCHLFLPHQVSRTVPVPVPMPEIDTQLCNHCGMCARICEYNAILCTKDRMEVSEDLCHACGACVELCPQDAISETPLNIGQIIHATSGPAPLTYGLLDVGQTRAQPLIFALKHLIDPARINVLDAPPGTSCSVVETVRGADFICLVAEPTPFGLYGLQLAHEALTELGLPTGIVLSRMGLGDRRIHEFADQHGIEIYAEIPDDRRIAQSQDRGQPLWSVAAEYQDLLRSLAERIEQRVTSCAS